jgi:hypothetical protein
LQTKNMHFFQKSFQKKQKKIFLGVFSVYYIYILSWWSPFFKNRKREEHYLEVLNVWNEYLIDLFFQSQLVKSGGCLGCFNDLNSQRDFDGFGAYMTSL